MSPKQKLFLFFCFMFTTLFNKTQNAKIGNYLLISNELEEAKCNYITCPSKHGHCKANKCICLKGFITFDFEKSKSYCNYEQKKSMTALLLEAFGLIGFGHFYAGRIFYGIIKIIIFYAIICFGTQFVIQFMKENTDSDIAYYIKIIISLLCIGTPLVWHFIDLFNWATNKYLDSNGLPLLDW